MNSAVARRVGAPITFERRAAGRPAPSLPIRTALQAPAAAEECLQAAEYLQERYPSAAAILRSLAERGFRAEEPKALRKRLLRRLWHVHYSGLARTAAARLLAVQWHSYRPTDVPLVPGSKRETFDRLHRAGARPLAWRQIADDLDPALD